MKRFLVILVGMVGCYDYSVESDGAECESGDDCVVCTDSDCSTKVDIQPSAVRDRCDPATFKANLLLGSCWTERCNGGERMLFTKSAGVNCVFKPVGAPNDEFVIGVCDDSGVCGK